MDHKNFHLVEHPVLKHKLAILRDKQTQAIGFRGVMKEIGSFLAYEASRDLATDTYEVETPMTKTQCERPKNYPIVVPVLRAGNGLLEGVLETLPFSATGHIGIYRDKFIHNTVEYYFKLPPNADKKEIYLLDPMSATGDTLVASLDRLKQYNVGQIKVLALCVGALALEKVFHFHPDVHIYALSLEEGINDKGYLLPGIGDAGDRLYQPVDMNYPHLG